MYILFVLSRRVFRFSIFYNFFLGEKEYAFLEKENLLTQIKSNTKTYKYNDVHTVTAHLSFLKRKSLLYQYTSIYSRNNF